MKGCSDRTWQKKKERISPFNLQELNIIFAPRVVELFLHLACIFGFIGMGQLLVNCSSYAYKYMYSNYDVHSSENTSEIYWKEWA